MTEKEGGRSDQRGRSVPQSRGWLYKLNITKRANKYNEGKSDSFLFRNRKIIGKIFKGGWEKEAAEKYREV